MVKVGNPELEYASFLMAFTDPRIICPRREDDRLDGRNSETLYKCGLHNYSCTIGKEIHRFLHSVKSSQSKIIFTFHSIEAMSLYGAPSTYYHLR